MILMTKFWFKKNFIYLFFKNNIVLYDLVPIGSDKEKIFDISQTQNVGICGFKNIFYSIFKNLTKNLITLQKVKIFVLFIYKTYWRNFKK